jgi:Zn-finger nucleic acid-binding protein
MSIGYAYKEKATQDLHETQAVAGAQDYASKKALKTAVTRHVEALQCPECGGHQLDGNKVTVEIGKVRFFQEEVKNGWFGSKKYVNRHVRDVWRFYRIYLEPSGFLGFLTPAGYVRCKNCKWRIKGGASMHWVSLGDVMKGKF